MRLRLAASLAALFAAPALAQDQPAVVVPSPPAIVAAPLSAPAAPAAPAAPPPPGLVETPAPPAALPGASGTPAIIPAVPAAPDAAPPAANIWLPGKTATLGVLNQVDGSTVEIFIPAGGQATAGDLTISVQACVSRPPDELPDAAVFLTVQNSTGGGAPLYRGWMVRSTPGASVVGDGSETFRVINCG